MADTVIGLIIQLALTFLVVKLYADIKLKNIKPESKMSYKDASEVIEKLENRISQLQERDAVSQEKIWNLEDQNRILKLHMLELKRDFAAKSAPIHKTLSDDGI